MGIFNIFTKKEKREPQEYWTKQEESFWQAFLLNETKFRHQEAKVKRSSKNEPITLEYILREILNIIPTDCGSMTVVSRSEFGQNEKTEFIEKQADVLAYKPYDAILYTNDEGETLPISGQNTVLIIRYSPADNIEKTSLNDKSHLCSDNSIIMFLRGMGPFIYETAYMRVSVMIPNFTIPDDFRTSNSTNAPFTTSFILGFDIVPPEEKLKRYNKIEKSLIEKSNQRQTLSQEEDVIKQGINPLGFPIGYGAWLVSEKRYADALLPLMKMYEYLKTEVVTKEILRGLFKEVCFNIGFCFNELGQYDRAAYYLGLIKNDDDPKYIIEYINALVNGGDPHAMNIIQYYISNIDEKNISVDRNINEVYQFLHRRLAYLFIEYKMWDKARNLLEPLKDIPSCRDFAIHELEYIDEVAPQ